MSEDRDPLSVYTLIAASIEQFAAVAWQKMGLQPDPLTGRIAPNHAEAKIAIDVCAELSGHLQSSLDEEDRRELQNLLRNLRLNFVEKSKDGIAGLSTEP